MSSRWKMILILSLLANLGSAYVALKAWEYRSHINEYRDKYRNVVREFSRRDVYERENRELEVSQSTNLRLVLFGSQIIRYFPDSIPFPGWEVINRGVPAQRAAGLVLRFQSDVARLRPTAVLIEFSQYNFRPHITVDELREYYLSIIQLATSNDITPIVTTVIPPRRGYRVPDNEDYSVADSTGVFNEWIRELSIHENYPITDFASTVSDTDGYIRTALTERAIDLNIEAYNLIAGDIRLALRTISERH